jgi:hypothetical protein
MSERGETMRNAIGEIRYDPGCDSADPSRSRVGGLLFWAYEEDVDVEGSVAAHYLEAPKPGWQPAFAVRRGRSLTSEEWRALPLVVIGEKRRHTMYHGVDATLVRVDVNGVLLTDGCNGPLALRPRDWFGLFEVEPVAAPVVEKRAEAARPVAGERRMWRASNDTEPRAWRLDYVSTDPTHCGVSRVDLHFHRVLAVLPVDEWLRATPIAAPPAMDMKHAFRLAREHYRPKAHYDGAFIDDPIALPPEPAAANRCPKCGGIPDYVGLNDVEHACPEVVCPLEVRAWYSVSRRETEYRATRGWSGARPVDGARLFDERGPTREHAIAALRAAERAAGLFAEGDE